MSLKDLQKQLNKEFGKDTVNLGEETPDINIISSFGSLALDVITGLGGIPRGRIIELYGPPSGGKTLLSILMGAEVQKKEGVVGFLDLENTFSKEWYKKQGGSISDNNFLYSKPKSGAEAYEMIEDIVESNEVDLLIVDSVAALATEAEIEGGYGDAQMAQLARLMSSGLKKLNNTMIKNDKCSVVFINQTRSSMNQYEKDKTTGGNALPFYSTLRIEVRRVGGKEGILGDKDNPIGFKTKIRLEKNKVGRPFRVVETNLYIGPDKYGVDINEEIIGIALSMDLIKRCSKNKETGELESDQNGSYYIIEDQQFYGEPKLKKYIEDNPQIIETLKNQVKVFLNTKEEPVKESFDSEIKKEQRKSRKSRKSEEIDNNETQEEE